MSIESARREIERFGWPAALRARGLRAAGRAVDFRVLRALGIERPSPEFLELPPRYAHRFLGEAALRRLAGSAECDMPAELLDAALEAGDRCHAILDGEVLASYGWYSRRPTPIEHGLVLHVRDPRCVYMYKAYTRPEYRGQRLHAIGVTLALRALLAEGANGLVSFVDAANLSSLRSSYRMGYEDLGLVYVLRRGARAFVHCDAECERHGLRIEALPAPSPVTARGGAASGARASAA